MSLDCIVSIYFIVFGCYNVSLDYIVSIYYIVSRCYIVSVDCIVSGWSSTLQNKESHFCLVIFWLFLMILSVSFRLIKALSQSGLCLTINTYDQTVVNLVSAFIILLLFQRFMFFLILYFETLTTVYVLHMCQILMGSFPYSLRTCIVNQIKQSKSY